MVTLRGILASHRQQGVLPRPHNKFYFLLYRSIITCSQSNFWQYRKSYDGSKVPDIVLQWEIYWCFVFLRISALSQKSPAEHFCGGDDDRIMFWVYKFGIVPSFCVSRRKEEEHGETLTLTMIHPDRRPVETIKNTLGSHWAPQIKNRIMIMGWQIIIIIIKKTLTAPPALQKYQMWL